MAKTYIDTVKYVVNADFEIKGSVEKPDIIGAIFGQTEGLLGDQLDLRELQKSGRVGRIEVKPKSYKGKTSGDITLPSSLDRVETSIIAAALETVDRIGPCEARIKVKSVEDTRTKKRQDIIDRAKQILKTMVEKNIPESKELSEMVRDEVKTAEVINWGPDKLPSGPGIEESENILVVEGRADVLTLLRADITNVTSLQGKNIPKSVVDLSHKKTITLFVDGDRGGDLIVKNFMETGGEADFVCKAPDGKEVEELTPSEVMEALDEKIPIDEITKEEEINEIAQELRGTLEAVLLKNDGSKSERIPVSELVKNLQDEKDVKTVVFDGIVTGRLIDTAKEKNINTIIGERVAEGIRIPRGIDVKSFKDLN